MSSKPEAESDDLDLPELPGDIGIKSGPTIDSSDEFPLPSFDLDEIKAISPDILFPVDPEPTAEELPAARASVSSGPKKGTNQSSASERPSRETAKPSAQAKPDQTATRPPPRREPEKNHPQFHSRPNIEVSFQPLDPLPFLKESGKTFFPPEESLDDDYFEAGLSGDETRFTPPATPNMPTSGRQGQTSTRKSTPNIAPSAPVEPVKKAVAAGTMASAQPARTEQPERDKQRNESKPGSKKRRGKAAKSTAIDEIFFDDQTESSQETAPGDKVSREEWAEEVPVDQYVRKVKVKRRTGGDKPKVRPWIPVVGVAAIVLGFVASKPLFAKLADVEVSNPVLVVASSPQGEVFLGETSLGLGPIALTAEQAARTDLEIRKDGFVSIVVTPGEVSTDGPTKKFMQPFVAEPVALSWDGLPEKSTLLWNGKKVAATDLAAVEPGKYALKVKPADRPAVAVSLSLEPRGKADGPFSVGPVVQAEFAKQPTISVGLSLPEKTSAKDLALTVKSLDGKVAFDSKLKVSSGTESSLVFPAAGKYKIAFAGNETFKAASQTVELSEGGSQDIKLTLAKQPPKPVVAQPTYQPSNNTYQPAPVYRPYRPPARPYSGGGGGGRIAPPAF
jgi:hypothetical protein